jgi:Cys-rich protein (TIGR01571 family)
MSEQAVVHPSPEQGYQHPQHHTVVIQQQPVMMARVPAAPQNIRDWSTGLCGCFEDCGICVFAFLCWPCYECMMASELNESACGPYLCGSLFLTGLRSKVRTMYGIRGSVMDDACCILCCPICAVTQMHREVKNNRSLPQ